MGVKGDVRILFLGRIAVSVCGNEHPVAEHRPVLIWLSPEVAECLHVLANRRINGIGDQELLNGCAPTVYSVPPRSASSGYIHLLRASAREVRQDEKGLRLIHPEVLALLVHPDREFKGQDRVGAVKLLITNVGVYLFDEAPNLLFLLQVSCLRAIGQLIEYIRQYIY